MEIILRLPRSLHEHTLAFYNKRTRTAGIMEDFLCELEILFEIFDDICSELEEPFSDLEYFCLLSHFMKTELKYVHPRLHNKEWFHDWLQHWLRTDFFFWNRIPAKEQVDYIFKRDLWKIKPEFEDRMIRAGYGKDPWNKSYGKYFDIERGFHGYPGPLTKKLNK